MPIITLKRSDNCADCGAELLAGSRARYYGPGQVYGVGCHNNKPQISVKPQHNRSQEVDTWAKAFTSSTGLKVLKARRDSFKGRAIFWTENPKRIQGKYSETQEYNVYPELLAYIPKALQPAIRGARHPGGFNGTPHAFNKIIWTVQVAFLK